MLNSILSVNGNGAVTTEQFFICLLASLILGCAVAFLHTYRNRYSKNFILTLVLLPAIVQSVIMVVNGNLGAGVAVMGAFSLVRFRSAPGDSREIASIFLAMAVGLSVGMGYIGMAVLLVLVLGIVQMLFITLPVGQGGQKSRELKVTIAESLDYMGIFDDIFQKYTDKAVLMKVKTVNMGSLYELCYRVELKKEEEEKQMLDDIRCRNGNLTIICGRIPEEKEAM